MKKRVEYLVFSDKVSNYQISKGTGISQTMLGRYANEVIAIEDMSFGNALKINKFFEATIANAQEVEFEGKTLYLMEEAYLNQDHEKVFYQAEAVDEKGNKYLVKWLPVENYHELDDGSDHCDWLNPIEAKDITGE